MCVTFGDDQRHVLGKNQDVSQLTDVVRKIAHSSHVETNAHRPLTRIPALHALQLYDYMIHATFILHACRDEPRLRSSAVNRPFDHAASVVILRPHRRLMLTVLTC